MSSQHVFLVQHEAFGLIPLKNCKTEKLSAGGEAGNGLVAKIVDFVHPRTGAVGMSRSATWYRYGRNCKGLFVLIYMIIRLLYIGP